VRLAPEKKKKKEEGRIGSVSLIPDMRRWSPSPQKKKKKKKKSLGCEKKEGGREWNSSVALLSPRQHGTVMLIEKKRERKGKKERRWPISEKKKKNLPFRLNLRSLPKKKRERSVHSDAFGKKRKKGER